MTAAHSGRVRVERALERGAAPRCRQIRSLLADGRERTIREVAEAVGCSVQAADYPVRLLERWGAVAIGWRHEPGRKGGPTRTVRRALDPVLLEEPGDDHGPEATSADLARTLGGAT